MASTQWIWAQYVGISGGMIAAAFFCAPLASADEVIQGATGDGAVLAYDRYTNDEFNFSVLYPSTFLGSQILSPDEQGRIFRSPDGSVVIRVYADENSLPLSLQERYQYALQEPDEEVTYHFLSNNAFVVSGYVNDDVFYEKTILEDGVYKTLSLNYDRSLEPQWETIVTEIAQSFG